MPKSDRISFGSEDDGTAGEKVHQSATNSQHSEERSSQQQGGAREHSSQPISSSRQDLPARLRGRLLFPGDQALQPQPFEPADELFLMRKPEALVSHKPGARVQEWDNSATASLSTQHPALHQHLLELVEVGLRCRTMPQCTLLARHSRTLWLGYKKVLASKGSIFAARCESLYSCRDSVNPFYSDGESLFCLACGTCTHNTADCFTFVGYQQGDACQLLSDLIIHPAYSTRDLQLFANSDRGVKRRVEQQVHLPAAPPPAAAAAGAAEGFGESAIAAAPMQVAALPPGTISVPAGFKGPVSWCTIAGVSNQDIMQDNKRLKQDSTNLQGQLATLHEELRMSQQLQGQYLTKLNVLAGKYKELQHEHQQLQLHCQQLQQQCQQLHMQLQQRQQPQFQHKRHCQRQH
jgi:hypothetical protein